MQNDAFNIFQNQEGCVISREKQPEITTKTQEGLRDKINVLIIMINQFINLLVMVHGANLMALGQESGAGPRPEPWARSLFLGHDALDSW